MAKLKSNLRYKDLYELGTTPCICVLENVKKKRVLLFSSDNPLFYVSRLISSLIKKKHKSQELIRDRKKLKLKILETNVSDKWSEKYWFDFYTRNGYTFYTSVNALQFILHVRIDYRHGAMIELRNKGNKAIVVGVFSMLDEALKWVDEFYPDLDYINPVFACNKETRNYYGNK